jgi:hypothetical protein
MTENACVVIKHLDQDIAPEPAQPLAVGEHGDSVAGSLVNRLERLHLHTSNGIDRMRRRDRDSLRSDRHQTVDCYQ